MRRAPIATIVFSLAAACARHDPVEQQLDRAEQRHENTAETYALTRADMRAMHTLANDILARHADTARRLELAEAASSAAAARFGSASLQAQRAAADYEAAAAGYRRVRTVLIVAAASDLFLRGVCGPRVSTHRYRRELSSHGVDLRGKDIDHLIARARGGPDRPWNYLPLDSHINRSLQDGGLAWKLANSPSHTLNALAKFATHSLLCG